MTELITSLYYMVDDWASQQYESSEEAKTLRARQANIKNEIERRLGENGRDLLDELSNLTLNLEDIHDEALFRAAMELGVQIAQPRRGVWTAELPQ